MLSAFHPLPIHELKPRDKSRIESLLAYGDRLLVGLNTGSLRIFRVNENATPPQQSGENGNGDQPPPSPTKLKAVELLREEEKFSRRPVQQLAIVKEANLLVSLSDGYVSLHDLQTYQLVERIEKTKGATCFTVTSNVVKDAETNVPSLVSRMAVGVKRKLLCWTWRDMELDGGSYSEPALELGMEATVRSLNWVHGGNGVVKLVAGMDPGFSIVDPDAKSEAEGEGVKPVYKPASRQDPASGELAGVRFAAVSSTGMGYMGMASWVPKPMATGLSEGEVLLAKDVNTLFTDIDGKPIERRQIPWSLAPEAIGFSYPYLLALQPPEKGTLQIRNPETLTALQVISVPSASILHVPQPNISLAHAGKGFLVASDRTIWRMNALPYDAQMAELVERERFDEATSLLGLLEDTLIDDKFGRIREVKIKKAFNLFQQQKYRPALDLFTEAQAPPERVIALYPRSIAGELSSIPDLTTEASETENGGTEDEVPSKPEDLQAKDAPAPAPATPSKGMLSKFNRGHARKDSADTPSMKAPPRADADNMSIRTTRATPAKPADKRLEGEDLKFAVRCLCSFLAQARVQIQKYLSTDGTLKQSPPELDPETERAAFANLMPSSLLAGNPDVSKIDWQHELLETAKLVDTTLFRAYMLALPSLAGPLFRLDNFCDPAVVQASLYENERYGDLIDFLHGKRLHRQALEMLQKFGKGEAGAQHEDAVPEGMKGVERTVAYLKQLPPELVELVLEFVRWPLELKREKGMEVFVADTDYAERLPRQRVVEFLADVDEELEDEYLEHVINELGDGTSEFHQKLVDTYIARLRHDDGADGREKNELRLKLEAFLRKSTAYNKLATFRQLPADDPTFFEARAIVLSAMGNHKQALSIYVFQLKDYAKAEQYCNDIYLRQQQDIAEACLIDSHVTHNVHEKSTHEAVAEKDNVFAMLLGLYLRPTSGEEKRWPQALDLLSRHGARLPASSTLDLMPDDLAVSELQEYFRGRIRNGTSVLRETSVIKSLAGVQRVNAERHWLLGADEVWEAGKKGGRNRRVRISEEDHCRVCHKRFGASAVKVYPDNVVVHYGCVPGRKAPESPVASRRMMGGGQAQRGWG